MAGLPDFDHPPVIETVLSVQFGSLKNLTTPHFGIYWERVRKKYKRIEVVPPIVTEIEDFGGEKKSFSPQTTIQFSLQSPDVRCWFIDESGNHLIQIQRDRFIHNWRKVRGDEEYPHYERIQPVFKEEWLQFCSFLREEKLEAPEVIQCEVTYVNHIELDGPAKSFSEMHRVIHGWSSIVPTRSFLPKPEQLNINCSYEMTDKRGRLYISLQPVIRSRDAKEVIQLNLTARGKPNSSDVGQIMEWLDLGREWIVRGFTDFTSDEMHNYWRRKNDR